MVKYELSHISLHNPLLVLIGIKYDKYVFQRKLIKDLSSDQSQDTTLQSLVGS